MRYFDYKHGEMYAENVPLAQLAAEVGTPCYIYSAATLKRHYEVFERATAAMRSLIAFSVKANSNLSVLKLLAGLGAGADVVSEGELVRALAAGIPSSKIVFSGVGKTRQELRAGLAAGIRQFNVESMPELDALSVCATEMGKTATIAFRINPDVSAGGHEKITTGKAENKFGIGIDRAREAFDYAAGLPSIKATGVDMHIGSQIDSLEPFAAALDKCLALITALRADGHTISSYDVGGGLGIPYDADETAPPLPALYGEMIAKKVKGFDLEMIFEPGRMIAGNAGILLSKVIYVKTEGTRNFLILDAAMNDLIRPALYGAHHDIEPVSDKRNESRRKFDVVGPVCETGDTFTRERELPGTTAGELIVIHSAGAYGAVQASQYNSRPLIPEIMVSDDQYAVVRARPTIEDMLKVEKIPDWL